MADELVQGANEGWLLGPADRLVRLSVENMKLGITLQSAVIAVAKQGVLIQTARQYVIEDGGPGEPFDAMLERQQLLGPWAQEVVDADFHPLHVNTLVAIWAEVEVAIEDTIVLLLLRSRETLELVEAAGHDLRAKLTTSPTEKTARRAFKRFENQVREVLDAGPALVEMLNRSGLRVKVSEEVQETLTEINEVRNCILHRGGVADERFAESAPNLGLQPGEPVRLTTERMMHYLGATKELAVGLVQSVTDRLSAAQGAQ